MDVSSLIDFINDKYPENSIELCESMDLLVDSLNSLKSTIGNEYKVFDEKNDYSSITIYMEKSKQILEIIEYLKSLLENLSPDESIELDIEDININETQLAIDYNDNSLDADTKVPHTLYEDFTYTRPFAIEIEDEYIKSSEWRGIFNKTCQYLYERNPKLFESFLDDRTMRGRTKKYFSIYSNELREPKIINGTNIYSEGNVSATFVRNVIIKMLEKYEIPKRKCHIFIRRDLTSLHIKEDNKR